MNRIVYGVIALVGIVTAILEFTVGDRPWNAYTILLLTSMAIGGLYLFTEMLYYRRHHALLANLQFLVIPILVLVLGSILAPLGWPPVWVSLQLNLFTSVYAISTMTSFLLVIPMVILFSLFSRYYDGRYPGFVIGRRQYGPKKLPLLIHFLSIMLLMVVGSLFDHMDFMGLVYIVGSVVFMIYKLVIPFFQRQRNRNSSYRNSERRSFLNSIRGSSSSRRRRSSRSLPAQTSPSRRMDTSSLESSSSSSRPQRRSRNISTTPSNGYREVPVRSRNSSSPAPSRTASRPPQRNSVAEVDRGIDVVTPTKTRKVKSSKLGNYVPKGNFDHTDLKCMVCYEDFKEGSSQNIVICPSCKFPAHEVEFRSWLNTSPRCPRCNKEVNRSKLSSGTVSESQYATFIRKL